MEETTAGDKYQSAFLIIDDQDENLLTKINNECPNSKVYFAKSLEQAKKYINDLKTPISGIFLNPDLSKMQGWSLLKDCHQQRASVPIYILNALYDNIGEQEEIGVHGILKSFLEIKNIIFEIEESIQKQGWNNYTVGSSSEIKTNDESDLIPILAQNFLSGRESFFDVYVKIGNDKFLKILHQGHKFEATRLNKYLSKGLLHLYIPREAQKGYIAFCGQLTSKIINSPSISNNIKMAQTFNHGQEILGLLKDQNLDQDSLKFAEEFAKNASQLVSKLTTKSKDLKLILKNITTFEHTAGVVMISGMMARCLGNINSDTYNALALGATLHDIGLNSMKDLYKHEYQFKLLDEEIIEKEIYDESCPQARHHKISQAFLLHPEIGVEMVKNIDHLDPLVSQIIGQHHMKMDNSGFPFLGASATLHPLSQIVGLSDEFAKVFKKMVNGELSDKQFLLMQSQMNGYSGQVTQIFNKLFLKIFQS